MQNGRGKFFKIVLVSMMLMMFLSTALYSLMYMGQGQTQEESNQNLSGNEQSGEINSGSGEYSTGVLEGTGN